MINWIVTIALILNPLVSAQASGQVIGPFKIETQGTKSMINLKKEFETQKAGLPREFRRELELFFAENPSFTSAEVVVRPIDSSKRKIEIAFWSDKKTNQGLLKIDLDNPQRIEVRWVDDNKKSHKAIINEQTLAQPMTFFRQSQIVTEVIPRSPGLALMPFEQIRKLKPEQRAQYIESVRSILVAAEGLQVKSKSESAFLLKLVFGSEAYANSSKACVVAGWAGNIINGRCQPIDEKYAIQNGNLVCNPDFFKSSLKFPLGSVPGNATFQCDKDSPTQDFAKDLVKNVTKPYGYDQAMELLGEKLDEMRATCISIQDAGNQSNTPNSACSILMSRIDNLSNLNCKDIVPNANICMEQAAVTGLPLIEKQQDTAPQAKLCSELDGGVEATNVNTLECGVSPNRVITESCRDNAGKESSRIYCRCSDDYYPIGKNTLMPLKCQKKNIQASTKGLNQTAPRSAPKAIKKTSWFTPGMGVVLAAVAGVMVWRYTNKKTLQSVQSSQWQPSTGQPAFFIPGLNQQIYTPNNTINPAPQPVDVNRPAPAAL